MAIVDLPSELLVAVLAKTSTLIVLRCMRVSARALRKVSLY